MSALNSSLLHLFNVDITGLNLKIFQDLHIEKCSLFFFKSALNNLTWGTHAKDQSI